MMTKPTKLTGKVETLEMVDGRVYLSNDHWVTVYRHGPHRIRKITDKDEADRIRFIAVAQSSAGRY